MTIDIFDAQIGERQARTIPAVKPAMPHVAAELAALLDLKAASRAIRPRQEIISEGKRCNAVFLISDGIAIRFRILRDGQRQILNFLLPGDFAGITSCRFDNALYSVRTLTPAVIAPVPVARLLGLFETHPQLAAQLFWSFAGDTAILAEHLIAVGRRSALERTAHLLLELHARLREVGLADDRCYRLPLTQEMISDALGLSHPLCQPPPAAAAPGRSGDGQGPGRRHREHGGPGGAGRFRARLSAAAVDRRVRRGASLRRAGAAAARQRVGNLLAIASAASIWNDRRGRREMNTCEQSSAEIADRTGQAAPELAPELTVVIPTLNERDNVPLVVERLNRVLAGIAWEVIFVDDDSPDGTAEIVRALAQTQPNIRCLHRLGRRGLSSACIEGMLASAAPYAAVMDGDLQHDENLLPVMLAKIKAERLDIVVASRHVGEGGVGDWQRSRVMISDFANRLGRLVVKADLSDPMSGFFLIRREAFTATMRSLSGQGFKILLDLFASAPRPLAFAEVPLKFRQRLHGESKLDAMVAWEYVTLLLEKIVGPVLPVRFLLFSMIGGLGVGTHLLTLWFATHVLLVAFAIAQSAATLVAMTGNFFLNNLFTYRDRRLRGRRLLAGLVSFYAVCGAGAAANVGVASYLVFGHHSWWLAGLAGAAVSVVWNYAMSAIFTWSPRPAAVPATTAAAVPQPAALPH